MSNARNLEKNATFSFQFSCQFLKLKWPKYIIKTCENIKGHGLENIKCSTNVNYF